MSDPYEYKVKEFAQAATGMRDEGPYTGAAAALGATAPFPGPDVVQKLREAEKRAKKLEMERQENKKNLVTIRRVRNGFVLLFGEDPYLERPDACIRVAANLAGVAACLDAEWAEPCLDPEEIDKEDF